VICQRQAQRHLSGQTRSVELAAIDRRVCENEWDLLELLAEQGVYVTRDAVAQDPVRQDPVPQDPVPQDPVRQDPVPQGAGTGHPVYGRPTLGELVTAVRESLQDAAAGKGPPPSGYAARVAANVLAIAERELARGAADQRAYASLLARLGVADEAALAAQVRAGHRDQELAEIAGLLGGIVAARLSVAHPGYDRPKERPGQAPG
jgi:hypothetical protein